MLQAFYEATRDVMHTVNCVRRVLCVEPHFHQSIEISYFLAGETDFFIGSECYHVTPGDITVVPPYYAHYTDTRQAAEAAVVIVPKKYYEDFERETGGGAYFYLSDKAVNEKIGQLICEFTDKRTGMSEFMVRAYTNMIFGYIASSYKAVKPNSAHNDLMIKIIDYINHHYEEDMTLESISSYFGYSKYYFSRLFNNAFHCNLNSYINSVRARAVSQNADRGKKTEAIVRSGFNSLSSYYRIKKKEENAYPKVGG